MTAVADAAARETIVSYVTDALKSNSSKELRIAFLTRDAVAEVVGAVLQSFVAGLAQILRARDSGMEPLQGELHSGPLSGIQWRHSTWRRGTAIRLEFQKSNWAAPVAGLCSPAEQALDGTASGEYEALDRATRDEISALLRDARNVSLRGRANVWWPAFKYLESPLDDWNSAPALVRVAGVELYEGRVYRDWLADEFLAVRQAVRPIIG